MVVKKAVFFILAVIFLMAASGCHPSETASPVVTTTADALSGTASSGTAADSDVSSGTDTQTITGAEATVPPADYDYTQPVPAGDKAEDGYFDDAVFIGDSRTEGMFLYGTFGTSTFLCGKGATVSNISTKQNVTINGADTTIMDALTKLSFSKVYISLGLNELGWNNVDAYQEDYSTLIDTIRSLRPDAIIYIQNIIPVNPDVCLQHKQAPYINNDRISQYNALLYSLAAEKNVFLLQISEAFTDASGILPAADTTDGIHLNAPCYQQWCDYLRTHTVSVTAASAIGYQTDETAADSPAVVPAEFTTAPSAAANQQT